MSQWLGQVVIVIDGRPYKYGVSWTELQASSMDLTRRFPVVYLFRRDPGGDEKVPMEFNVKVFDLVASELGIGKSQLHLDVVKYASTIIARKKQGEVFDFGQSELGELKNQPKPNFPELRRLVLRHAYLIYNTLPKEELTTSELLVVTNGDKEHIGEAFEALVKQEFLERHNFKRVEFAGTSETAYRLNPAKLDEVEAMFTESDSILAPKVFLSYSHKDKQLAGALKRALEESGKDFGLDAFLAHEDIKVSKEWMKRIIEELDSCPFYVAVLSRAFDSSQWTNQEAGYALAKGAVVLPLKTHKDPKGLLSSKQAIFLTTENITKVASDICEEIRTHLANHPKTNRKVEVW
jgi:hypothetical protein